MSAAFISRGALAAIAAAALVGLGVTPASASPAPRPLPPTNHLYAVGCDPTLHSTLVSVDPTTGVLTQIGTDQGGAACSETAAWDRASQTAYYINKGSPQDLYSLNIVTGVATVIGEVHDGSNYPTVNTMMIASNGDAYLLANNNVLFSLNLNTAIETYIADGPGEEDPPIYASAFDCSTGSFYTVDQAGVFSETEVRNGSSLNIADLIGFGGGEPYSMQIDAGGTLWIEADTGSLEPNFGGLETDPGSDEADLWTVDQDEPGPGEISESAIEAGPLQLNGANFYSKSLMITGPPTCGAVTPTPVPKRSLALTGVDAATPLTLGAILLGLGGLVVLSRRLARRQGSRTS